jgi:hypothetical protein
MTRDRFRPGRGGYRQMTNEIFVQRLLSRQPAGTYRRGACVATSANNERHKSQNFSTEIAEIDEIAENPRLRRRCAGSSDVRAPTAGVGATANSAISSISAISVQKNPRPNQRPAHAREPKPRTDDKERRSCCGSHSRNDGIFSSLRRLSLHLRVMDFSPITLSRHKCLWRCPDEQGHDGLIPDASLPQRQ